MKRSLGAFLLLCVLSTLAFAQPAAGARRYAVLSLIGDAMTVVTYEAHTGSNLDTNRHEVIPLDDTTFDDVAARAVETALRRSGSGDRVQVLAASSKSLYSEQRKLFDGSRVALDEGLATSLRRDGATHLILVTKYRAEARITGRNGPSVGGGYLEGLGFYIDRPRRRLPGFLAPFAYIKVSLVDLATSTVVGEDTIMASRRVSAARSDTMFAWDALSPEEKTQILRRMIAAEVSRVVPIVVKAEKP